MTEAEATLAAELEGIEGLRVRADVPLARLTTFKIGGPARLLVTPESVEALADGMKRISDSPRPRMILGNGSNLLIADEGFDGVVIRVASALGFVEALDQDRLRIGAGTLWSKVLRFVMSEGWTGLEWGAGIPGTVGGAVATNAGTRGGETSDSLLEVEGVDRHGQRQTLARRDIPFFYRRGELPEGFVVTAVTFSAHREDPAAVTETVRAYQAERRRDQPEREPSAGCIFQNPPGESAGRLIDRAGLKGESVGGAVVSPVHGNFIINRGGATASDVRRLIARIRERVAREAGIELELEVRLVGFPS